MNVKSRLFFNDSNCHMLEYQQNSTTKKEKIITIRIKRFKFMSMESILYFEYYVMQKMLFEHVFQVELILVLLVLMYRHVLSILILKENNKLQNLIED